MDLFSIFKGGKYFDKHIEPKCDYCQFGRRAKDGEKVICEKRGLVQRDDSCSKFIYSPLKRIPVKQLNFVGSLADEDIYIESAGDIAEKQEEINKNNASEKPARKAVPKEVEEKLSDVKILGASEKIVPENAETAETSPETESTEKNPADSESVEEFTEENQLEFESESTDENSADSESTEENSES